MTTKVGLSEDEYLALMERIQRAMCIEPFRPDVTDVVVLIGTVHVLNRKVERLEKCQQGWSRELDESVRREGLLRAEVERLRNVLDEIAAEDDE